MVEFLMQFIVVACIIIVVLSGYAAYKAVRYLWWYLGQQAEREAQFLEEHKRII